MYQWHDITSEPELVNVDNEIRQLSTGGIGEIGTIEKLTDQWQTVKLKEAYSYPVILAGLASPLGDQAAPRIRKVNYPCDQLGNYIGWCFDIALHEPVRKTIQHVCSCVPSLASS